MLLSLKYHVEFPSTGRTFSNQLVFEPGLTAITGRNEEGKSLIVELIGYCLFGKAALRGAAEDYKNLSVTLEAHINNSDVKIERSPKREVFFINGEQVAVKADAINKAVPAFLGFGLDVYHIANVAEQDNLNALTEMKPTARKNMVDQIIGANVIEAIERECKDEAKQRTAIALHLITSVSEPIKPTEPEGYVVSTELEEEIQSAERDYHVRERCKSVPKPDKPVAPDRPSIDASLSELEEHQEQRSRTLLIKSRLEGELASIPEPRFTEIEVIRAIAYKDYVEELQRRGPKPDPAYTLDQLHSFEHIWNLKFKISDTEICPQCGFEFDPQTGEGVEKYEDPPLTMGEVREQITRHLRWFCSLDEAEEFIIPDLKKEIQAHESAGRATGLRLELSQLSVPPDRAEDYALLRDYERRQIAYSERAERYESDFIAWEEAQATLAQIDDPTERLREFLHKLSEARLYEQALVRYEVEFARYKDTTETASQKEEEADGFLKGMFALKETRSCVKQELVPSLSKAASDLLASLTNGERRYVVVDEEFNVTVDGQPLRTLSGSGKAVVNLALRIGLAQVLTAKVLSLFIGDEIDGSMDADRAGATHLTFRNLTKYLKQVILVTHKDIEADNIIDLSVITASQRA